jgi:hypothetical protein
MRVRGSLLIANKTSIICMLHHAMRRAMARCFVLMHTDSIHTERSMYTESMHTDSMHTSSMHTDSICSDSMHTGSMHTEHSIHYEKLFDGLICLQRHCNVTVGCMFSFPQKDVHT